MKGCKGVLSEGVLAITMVTRVTRVTRVTKVTSVYPHCVGSVHPSA